MNSNLHILVVDDLPVVRWVITAMLEEIGCTNISKAGNGKQALELIQSSNTPITPINFVVTDWNMPVMDGLALLKAIRASPDLRHLPVVMITGEKEIGNIIDATQAGVDGYIPKSILSTEILKETMDKILAKRGGTM